MAQLPAKAIDKFMALWKEKYGEDVSQEEATQKAHQLVNLLDILTRKPEEPECKVKNLELLNAEKQLKAMQFQIEIDNTEQSPPE